MSKVLYICSAGHSGSTLLDLLLGRHSNITSLGEISQLPKNLSLNTNCTCGKPVRECELWTKVLQRLDKQIGISTKDDPYSLNLGYFSAKVVVDHVHQNLLHKIKRKLVLGLWYASLRSGIPVPEILISKVREGAVNSFLLYKQVSDIMDTDYVIDSSKNYLKAISLYKNNPDKVKIILLSRDGRGVFYSGRKRNFSKDESLNAWKKYYTRAIPLLEQHVKDKDIIRVRYEDLAVSPEKELKRICDFIGLSFEGNMLKYSSKTYHITNGNNMRFKQLDINIDFSWKNGLLEDDMAYFLKKAGLLNVELGYGSKN